MNFKPQQIDSFCRNPNLDIKCVILYGNNEGLIADLQKKCAKAVCENLDDAFRCCTLNMDNISDGGQEVYAEYYAQSLMGGRRAILVKNANNDLTPVLKNIIPEIKSENLLVVSSAVYNTKSALIAWAKDRNDVIIVGCYEDRDIDMASVAQSMLREKGLAIDVPTLQVLASRLSPDRKVNQGEIDKLAVYLGDRKTVSVEDVCLIVSDVAGASFEDLCYNVAEGNVLNACNIFNRLIKEGEEPATLIRQISYHFSKLLACVAQMEDGKTTSETITSLRPPLIFYRKNSFIAQLSIWKKERILSALNMLYECERDCKTTNLPAEECASYTIMRLAGAVKKIKGS